nr:protein afg1 [Quercus suber]
MASREAVQLLHSIFRNRRIPNALVRQQRRTLCHDCLSKKRPSATPFLRSGTAVRPAAVHVPRAGKSTGAGPIPKTQGPIAEYDERVRSGRLRNDQHQRTLIQSLQDLHDMLLGYTPPAVVHPTIESLQPRRQKSFLGSIFGGDASDKPLKMEPPDSLPKGLYMYGDVGSGKTMLMDLFYDTLPESIHSKTRIHFHNFMQDVHKELHKMKMQHGSDVDAIPFVAASIAEKATVLCFDEFQCTDVADAMILRRLMESLMAHGTVLVTTSNRHPKDLYKNGIQRESFIPCINLLLDRLRVLNLDSTTDYRKIPRPPSGVYHHPLDSAAKSHVDHWFRFLGDFEKDPPHTATHEVWGREISVPRASGSCALFSFQELIGRATGAADYIELCRSYDSFIITDVPGMNMRSRDLARRFITFIDAVYEARAKLVLTTGVSLTQLFMTRDEIGEALTSSAEKGGAGAAHASAAAATAYEGADVNDAMRSLMDDLGMNMDMLKNSSIFSGDEEAFAFARALSRLSEMGSQEWVERGMGLERDGGRKEKDDWARVKSNFHQDSR